MKKLFCLIFICSLIIGLTFSIFHFYASPKAYAQDTAEKEKEPLKCRKKLIEDRKEAEERYKEEEKKHVEVLKKVYGKMNKRTKECKESIDSLIFTLQSLAKQAYTKGETEREKEILSVLIDYNSVKGDLDAVGVLLSMSEFVEGKEFSRYFDRMAQGYEYIKGGFGLKNELLLRRISELKNKDALGYEKKLYSLFCRYFEYDLWQDKQAWAEPEVEAGKGKKKGEEE
jgi:hypothetical protein